MIKFVLIGGKRNKEILTNNIEKHIINLSNTIDMMLDNNKVYIFQQKNSPFNTKMLNRTVLFNVLQFVYSKKLSNSSAVIISCFIKV